MKKNCLCFTCTSRYKDGFTAGAYAQRAQIIDALMRTTIVDQLSETDLYALQAIVNSPARRSTA